MKTGLIVEGGGMKCAYSAGILDAFIEEGITFDHVYGVSAGASNAVTYIAGQHNRCRRFYVSHAATPRYASTKMFLRTGNYFDLNYIYATMSNEDGVDPLDYDAFEKSPMDFTCVATDALTGEPHYFRKSDIRRNHYEPIMASCALPVFCHPIVIDGRTYFDGGMSDSLPVGRALRDGCDRIVVLSSKTSDFEMNPQGHKLIYNIALRKYPMMIKALSQRYRVYNHQMKRVRQLEEQGRLMIYYRPSEISVSTTKVDPVAAEELYQRGRDDLRTTRDEFMSFIGKD